jgi:ribosomal protein S18 acetylase RimI-like enzyme
MNRTITVTRVRADAFRAVAELDRLAWRDYPEGRFVPDGEHVWRHWTEDALVFGAFRGDRLLGAVLAFPGLSGRYCLHKAFVHPDERGRGLGTRLLEALLVEVDRLAVSVYLTVNPANVPARELYTRFGFRERETVLEYYGPGQDRLIMERVRAGETLADREESA